MSLIFADNADAPVLDKGASLTCCAGLSNMVQLRNDAQAQQVASATGSTLFEANDEDMKKKRPAMSRLELKEKGRNIHLSQLTSQWMMSHTPLKS